MATTRREFLASMLAALGAAALPAQAAPVVPRVRFSGPIFTAAMQDEAHAGWFRDCVLNSAWQFEPRGLGGRPLLRHPMTGLTYVVFPDGEGGTALQQIDAACCPCREDLDPDYIVSHAARFVAAHIFEFYEWTDGQPGAATLCFRDSERYALWPELAEAEIEAAPPIKVTLLPKYKADAQW
jgi:hypothetical protein